MISIKEEVRKALSGVCDGLVYGYPRSFADIPLLAWRESLNRCHAQADGREHLAELNYTVDIFAGDSAAANELLTAADDRLAALGLRRENAAEQYDGDLRAAHITARYRALADAQGNIYQ